MDFRKAEKDAMEKLPPIRKSEEPAAKPTPTPSSGWFKKVLTMPATEAGKAIDIESAKAPAKRALGTVERIGVGVIRTAGLIKGIKGVKTENELIHNKALYGIGNTNPNFTPMPGASYDMGLYFGSGSKSVPRGATEVLGAIKEGYNVDQLEAVTGLPPQEINASLRYLVNKKLLTRQEATSWVR